MPPSVLHHGNVAQNGYNNAKFLRRLGVEAWAVCDEPEAFAQPEWEDAVLPPGTAALARGAGISTLDGWRRPEWVITPTQPRARFRGYYRPAYARALAANLPRLRRLFAELRRDYAPLRTVLGTPLTFGDVVAAFRVTWMHGLTLGPIGALYERFDLVQAYATNAILPLMETPFRPFVAFEHGTLRELPFEDSWRGRLLSLAYHRAHTVIITNADVIGSARRLGLENTIFVPHPVDETKYATGDSDLGRELRDDGFGPIVFAPARQDWVEKGTDALVGGFAAFVRAGHPRALLLLGSWGRDVARTAALVRDLGLDDNVRPFEPLPKLRLIDAYRAADIVVDQFVFGTFGAIAPEAMACERPVVMAFDPELHEWCFPEPPPIVSARAAGEIGRALIRLAGDREERDRLGRAGRQWVEKHHGWRLVASRQKAIYEEVLSATT
ncbi:MAG: glycosyltransferase [Actinomycetota bacterium]